MSEKLKAGLQNMVTSVWPETRVSLAGVFEVRISRSPLFEKGKREYMSPVQANRPLVPRSTVW